MKNLKFFYLALTVALALLAIMSCTKDDDERSVDPQHQQALTAQMQTNLTGAMNTQPNDDLKCGYGSNPREGILDVIQLYQESANAGDFELWMSLWADDGIRMPPGEEPQVGKEVIAAAMQPAFELFDIVVDIYEINEVHVFGHVGATRCRYNIYATPKGGGDPFAIEPDGKALTLLERDRHGEWKIIYDCINSNLPPM
jgi:uncharacterized protein (TIGR02246 family)